MVDPFPVAEYHEGMITVIGAPEFPPAVAAVLSSGDVCIPILLRRKPCMTYGQVVLGTEDDDTGPKISITMYKGEQKTNFTIRKCQNGTLSQKVQCEKLFSKIKDTKRVFISVGETTVYEATFTNEQLESDIFEVAPYMICYYEALQTIEEQMSCHFDVQDSDVSERNYVIARTMAASLKGKWHQIKTDFDDEIRCDYDQISDDIEDGSKDGSNEMPIVAEEVINGIELHGKRFSVKKYIVVYKNARINNINSVIKRKRKHCKNIMVTFRPIANEKTFSKFCKMEGIVLCDNSDTVE